VRNGHGDVQFFRKLIAILGSGNSATAIISIADEA
jgi:hypothetical protein